MSLNRETVCYIAVKAREFDAKVDPVTPDRGDNPVDDADREILFDYADDPTAEELSSALRGLNVDQRIELLALVWLGRGDYSVSEWRQAMAVAASDSEDRRPEAFLAIPLLAEYLENGLSELGLSCADVALDHL